MSRVSLTPGTPLFTVEKYSGGMFRDGYLPSSGKPSGPGYCNVKDIFIIVLYVVW